MTGFNPGTRIRRLEFADDTQFPGLWMRVEGMTFREWLDVKTLDELAGLLGARLVEWNWVDDNDQPVPATKEGLDSLDAADVRTLVQLYHDRVAEVHPAPLGSGPITPPDPDLEASIDMQPVSANSSG